MKQKSVVILSIVTVAALGVAAVALRDTDAAEPASGRALLFPELAEHINEVSRVRLEKGGKSATLERSGADWKLADRGGYPAQFEKVKEIAMRVADLEIDEVKTSKRENHAKLALEWPPVAVDEEADDAPDGEAALVTLSDAGGKELAALVVGKSEWRGSKPKVFVRRAGEDQVYLCSPRQSLEVDPEARRFIEPKFIEIASERVQDVTIEHADGERVEVGRSAANHTKFVVQNLPEGESERFDGVANGVAQALSSMQLDDVRPAGEVDFTKEPVAKTRFRCVDGLELTVETAKADEKTWVRIAASFTPPPEAAPAPEGSATGDASGAAAAEGAPEPEAVSAGEGAETGEKKDVAKEAADLNARLSPWAFQVASYKTDVLARRMKDLVAEPAEDGAADEGLDGLMEGMEPLDVTPDLGDGIEPPPSPDDESSSPPPSDEEPKAE